MLKLQKEQFAWNIQGTTIVELLNYHTMPKKTKVPTFAFKQMNNETF